jgi:hypothetical protein
MVIWKVLAEIQVEPDAMPSGSTKGFMNVTAWANSAEAARGKLARYLESFKWHLIDIEDAHPIDDDHEYGEEIEEMIERTRNNPNAIILGTLHTYKTN